MNEPDYYNHDGLSPIQAFKKGMISRHEYIGFCKGNIIKYVVRAGKKDDAVEDLEKAKNYIDFLLELHQMDDVDQDKIGLNCRCDSPPLMDVKKRMDLRAEALRNIPYRPYNMNDSSLIK